MSNGVADMFPDVDVPFDAYLVVKYDNRPLPLPSFIPSMSMEIRPKIIQALRLAEEKAEMQKRSYQVYTKAAGESLFNMLVEPSPKAMADYPDYPLNAQLVATALDLAADLRQRDDESDIDWDRRIWQWVHNNSRKIILRDTTGFGESLRIIRRQLLPGMPADIALCEAITADQPNWPVGLEKPPLKVDLPHVTIRGPVNEFLANLWQPVKNNAAKTSYPTVLFKAWHWPDDISVKAECAAVTEMNTLSDVPAKDFWEYTQRFGEPKKHHDWLAQYPALDRRARDRNVAERCAVLSKLDKVPFGYAAITGGPGSRKTSLAEDIVLAVVSEPCKEAPVMWTTPLGDPAGAPDGPDNDSDNSSDNDSDNDSDNASQDSSQATERTEPDRPTGFLAAWDYLPNDAPAKPPKVAWIATENQLCNDAQVRLSTKEPGLVILRAHSWKCEMHNMFSPSDREPDLISISEKPHATSQDRRLAEHINHQIRMQFDRTSAFRGPPTISEYAKQIARDNRNIWYNYLDAVAQKLTDPDEFLLNQAQNKEYARELLIHVLTDKVQILCCTPVDFAQIIYEAEIEMGFIVLDEASLMTESMSLIPMSKCPQASFLLVGDARQSSPAVTTVNRSDWKSFFGLQRKTSLLKRMEDAGAIQYLKPGHLVHVCEAPRCTTCDKPHATRYCPRAEENAIYEFAKEPITADDGIVRDASMASGINKEHGNRVAFRAQNRASRNPPWVVWVGFMMFLEDVNECIKQDVEE
ncbi:hypothetical protein ACHAP8_001067 [Fusarium lateritium]